MSVRTSKFIVLMFAALGMGGCGHSAEKQNTASAPLAPEFALHDLSGKTVRLADLRGKVVLLDFWATWCGPCHESIPFIEAIYEKYRSRGFEVVGVSEDVETNVVPPYARDNHMTYLVLTDPENKLFDDYEIRGLPATYLLDPQGRIRERWAGFAPDGMGDIEAAVKALLDESKK